MNHPSVRLRQLADELRSLREAAGKRQDEAAAAAGIDRSTLSKIENAHARPYPTTLDALLDCYGVAERKRSELRALRSEAKSPAWLLPIRAAIADAYASFIDLESRAVAETSYETLLVPGQLQTPGYMRAHAVAALPGASEDEITSRVQARAQRQQSFFARGTSLAAVITEAALHYRVGGCEVMRGQLAHLLERSDAPDVTLQIIPQGADAHPSMSASFCTLHFESGNAVVYLESATEARVLHNPHVLRAYTGIFADLQRRALDPKGSKMLIDHLLTELNQEGDCR